MTWPKWHRQLGVEAGIKSTLAVFQSKPHLYFKKILPLLFFFSCIKAGISAHKKKKITFLPRINTQCDIGLNWVVNALPESLLPTNPLSRKGVPAGFPFICTRLNVQTYKHEIKILWGWLICRTLVFLCLIRLPHLQPRLVLYRNKIPSVPEKSCWTIKLWDAQLSICCTGILARKLIFHTGNSRSVVCLCSLLL